MKLSESWHTGGSWSRALSSALVLGLGLAGCDALDRALQVEAEGQVDAEDLTDPANASVLVSGAVADFDCAFGAYIVNGGLLGNELMDASITAARHPLDQRSLQTSSPYGVNSCTGNPPGIYRPLSTALFTADNALDQLEGWTDDEVPGNRTALLATAAAYSGYSHTLMGEGFCSAVIDPLGTEVQSTDVFDVAVNRFTRAIEAAEAAGDDDVFLMSHIGRARANLNLGNTTEAAADARAVLEADPQFVLEVDASTVSDRRRNRAAQEFRLGRSTVDPLYRELTTDGESDPRVAVVDREVTGHDGQTPVFSAAKYEDDASSIPLATWREAMLIIAEAELGETAVEMINALREPHGLPAFSSSDDEEIMQQVIEERSRELFLESHHLNDLRRFDLPFLPEAGTPYPKGGQYGNVNCFPLPDVERFNNPNL